MDTAVRRRGRAARLLAAAVLLALGLLTIPAAAAAADLELTATGATVGGPIQATAELSGGVDATGTISFEVFGPGDTSCATPLTPTPDAATVSGDGSYPSGSFPSTVAGTYRWSARYSGDANNPAAEVLCAVSTSTVTQAIPTLNGSASSGIVGGTIGDQANLVGAFEPSQEVTFTVFAPDDLSCATPLATSSAPLAAGVAVSAPFAPQQAGEFRWVASYPGDVNNQAVSTPCGSGSQLSQVSKATPLLAGTATSAIQVGFEITDSATISGGFGNPDGELLFQAFGPADPTCAGAVAYEEAVDIDGSGTYAPLGFKPPAGIYMWIVTYKGDANNAATVLPCGSENQASAVGVLNVTLAASASGDTIGGTVSATATLANGATPRGQLTFRAFPPDDTSCSGAAAFTSTVAVAGNGSHTATYSPGQVGIYRWTVTYSGDPNHAAATTACGAAASVVSKRSPSISGKVGKRLTVGTRFRDTVTLTGAHAPTGTIRFEIYGPGAGPCTKPAFVNTVPVNGASIVQSDPFVAKRAGRYRFVAKYSGDSANQPAAEACGSPDQLARVKKRTPRLRPVAKLAGSHQISIRARLAGASSPTGRLSFRLYAPDNRTCKGRPVFAGSLRVRSNGTFSLAEYIATKPGTYRLGVAYSGDPRNAPTRISCAGTQQIAIT